MVMLNGAFDATQIDPLDRTTIPAGEYIAAITATEARANKSFGTGSHLSIEFTITQGEHQGRKVWTNLNCWHEGSPNSEKTKQIAWAELSSIARAVQVLNFTDTAALHNIPLIIQIKVNQQGDNEYKACKPIQQTAPQPSPGRAYAQANQPPAHNPNLNPDGTPKTPQQMAQQAQANRQSY